MKRIVTDDTTGLDTLLGERVTVWCLNYIYAGRLAALDDTVLLLEDASVVYETGPLTDSGYADAQRTAHPVFVLLRCVESITREA